MEQQNELTPIEEVLHEYMFENANLKLRNAELRKELRDLENNKNLIEEKRDKIEDNNR